MDKFELEYHIIVSSSHDKQYKPAWVEPDMKLRNLYRRIKTKIIGLYPTVYAKKKKSEGNWTFALAAAAVVTPCSLHQPNAFTVHAEYLPLPHLIDENVICSISLNKKEIIHVECTSKTKHMEEENMHMMY